MYSPQVDAFAMTSVDRDALETLFLSTGGDSWESKRYWDTNAELSTWQGVKVDEDGRVVQLDLYGNNLQGIPRSAVQTMLLGCDVLDRSSPGFCPSIENDPFTRLEVAILARSYVLHAVYP